MTRRALGAILAALLIAPRLALASPAAAPLPRSEPPPSTQLLYDVSGRASGFEYSAKGVLDWRLGPQGYEARMEVSMPLLGSRVQISQGTTGPEGLRPTRFADQRKNKEKAAQFERSTQRIRFSNQAPEAELMPGAQDRLSLFMQLAGLMRAQPRQEGEAMGFQVAGTGDAEPWRFDVGPLETLTLPAGNIEARRLLRAPRKDQDTRVEVWLAPSLGHLPVRLRVTQPNGDMADQRLAKRP
jgi:hypothetical protein